MHPLFNKIPYSLLVLASVILIAVINRCLNLLKKSIKQQRIFLWTYLQTCTKCLHALAPSLAWCCNISLSAHACCEHGISLSCEQLWCNLNSSLSLESTRSIILFWLPGGNSHQTNTGSVTVSWECKWTCACKTRTWVQSGSGAADACAYAVTPLWYCYNSAIIMTMSVVMMLLWFNMRWSMSWHECCNWDGSWSACRSTCRKAAYRSVLRALREISFLSARWRHFIWISLSKSMKLWDHIHSHTSELVSNP